MSKIKIFKEKKEIDLPTFVDSRFLICANSGGGKSYAVRKLLEETHGKVMSIVLDIEGEFKTLREKYDFLLIGDKGDVNLNQQAVNLLPKKILELNVSTIIDISDLKRNERILYVKKFLESLMECPREFWKPCLVILDEAHILAGQQEKQDSCYSVIDLMTRGRKRGFCGVLCTQRISKLHKDAVAECNNIMIGRTGLDIDMKRASEILGFTSKQDMLSLRELDSGEFYVFGTAISKGVTKLKVGEVNTTHPKVGMDLKSKIVPPTPKIKHMLSNLNDLPKEAEAEIKEKKDFIKKIRELELELRKKPNASIDSKLIERVKQQTFSECKMYNKKIVNEFNKNVDKFSFDLITDVTLNGSGAKRTTKRKAIFVHHLNDLPKEQLDTTKSDSLPIENKELDTTKSSTESIRNENNGEHNLNLCTRKVYSFLFENPDREFSRVQLATITGYSHRSGSFKDAISKLNVLNLISKNGDKVRVNEMDESLATEDSKELSIDIWMNRLNKCTRKIFKLLLENPDILYGREEIANETEYSSSSGSFKDAISKLNVLGLIQKEGTEIKLNPEILEL